MQKKIHWAALAACTAMALAGCGGGGDKSPANDLKGQWEGSLYLYPINGYNGYNDYRMIVLEDGSLWGTMSTNNYTASSNIQGMLHGTYSDHDEDDGTCDEDNICSTDWTTYFKTSYTQFNFVTGGANNQLGFSGTWNGSALDGRFSYGTSFKIPSGNYVQAVTLSSLAGVYSGYAVVSGSSSRTNLNGITISGSTLTLPADANGCSASGTLTPHLPQAQNGAVFAFDTSLTFRGTGCALRNGTTVQGITYQATFNDATAIQILTVTSDNQTGFMVTGIR